MAGGYRGHDPSCWYGCKDEPIHANEAHSIYVRSHMHIDLPNGCHVHKHHMRAIKASCMRGSCVLTVEQVNTALVHKEIAKSLEAKVAIRYRPL